jgi:poly(A) polymerase
MIRRLLARLLTGRRANAPRVYAPDKHPVRRDQLSAAARSVTRRLQDEGFKAFIVGGAVRDLLLGIEPKDFDIATDATPEQVKPLFRRAFIIGRRFRLVHVHVGNDVIEVSTFRAAQTGNDTTDEHGRLLSDNVYGSQAEDAVRRDFTANALYFDPATESIWDYVGGVVDIRARRLKLIGPPVTRYREDPVRMLRAVRLAAKLGLAIDPKSQEPIVRLAPLMANVPPARLFDEMQKLLLSGHAVETLRSLRANGLSHGLLPLLDVILEQPLGHKFIDAALAGTDARVRADKGVGRAAAASAVRGDGQGATRAGRAHRDPAPLRGDDQGDLVAAAAL